MNVLYLAHRIPYPPDKGDKLRAFHFLEHLAVRHRVWCACFVDDPRDLNYVEPLSRLVSRLAVVRLRRGPAVFRGLRGWIAGQSITASYLRHPAMIRILTAWSREVTFDRAVAFSSGMCPYLSHVSAARRVADFCDVDSAKWAAYADGAPWPAQRIYRSEAGRLRAHERRWARRCDATVVVSKEEASLIAGAAPDRLHVVGNGVANRSRQATPEIVDTTAGFVHRSPVVGFVGEMGYRPNVEAVVWFAHRCWPAIRADFDDAIFRIVGRRPARAVRRLARLNGVEVTGEVPDAAAYVRDFDVSVAPLRIGRGVQNKVLEAMAAAKPVVLTRAAATGIDARDGVHWRIADEPGDFVRQVTELLSKPGERRRLGTAAAAFVHRHHRWPDCAERFAAVVEGRAEIADVASEEPRPSPALACGTRFTGRS